MLPPWAAVRRARCAMRPSPQLRCPTLALLRPRSVIAAPHDAGGSAFSRCKRSHDLPRGRCPLQAEAPAALWLVLRGAKSPACPETLATVSPLLGRWPSPLPHFLRSSSLSSSVSALGVIPGCSSPFLALPPLAFQRGGCRALNRGSCRPHPEIALHCGGPPSWFAPSSLWWGSPEPEEVRRVSCLSSPMSVTMR